ncbi:hypothetical protein [Achromobacter xylosoxidans]|uniref:hypothetical protein n=1 Tax=Alcaligenes xylosoxydans xylosoxydans TaxID=85698 RepID=UPI003D27B22C
MNLLEGFGATHLPAENQSAIFFTPTELGKMMGGLSAQKVNLLLAGAGLQAKVGGYWKPLGAWKRLRPIVRHGKAARRRDAVQQVKWSEAVMPLMRKEDVA